MTPFSFSPPGAIDLEVASLLIEVFRPRRDLYAWRIDDASTAERLNAWSVAGSQGRARRWHVGEWRPAGSRDARRPVTREDVSLHVVGARTLGFYPMHADGTCNSISADFDNHRGGLLIERDPAEDFEALRTLLVREGIPHLAHHSRGGKGYWVHLLTPTSTPARDARAVMHGLLRAAGARNVAEGGTFDGLFPKQDEADPRGGPGNLFCLPLSRRWLANDPPGSGFVGVAPQHFEAQVYHLWKVRRIRAEQWHDLCQRFVASVRTSSRVTRASSERASSNSHDVPGAWAIALRRAGRLGRALGEGRHALLCINDMQHSVPDHSVEGARGSCVLFAPSERHPRGYPWCAHAHCAHLTEHDWVQAIGRDVWDDACLTLRGMRRAGPWLLHPGGISGWFRDASGVVVPSRRERLCAIPVWIVEDVHARGRVVRVIDAVVDGRARRIRVTVTRFAALTWMQRFGVDVDAMLPETRQRLVEAIEALSAPIPTRDTHDAVALDQVAAQARTDDLLALLRVVRDTAAMSASNDTSPKVARAR